jgi:hypothetical protein
MPGELGLGSGTASPRTKQAMEELFRAISSDARRAEEHEKRVAGEPVKRQKKGGGSRRGRRGRRGSRSRSRGTRRK